MTATPRLTIGLPVYNGAESLGGALEALLGQTYEDFELIISDNASTDATGDICRFYEKLDPRVHYYRQPVNRGSAANHNFVVDQANGELFKFASHDDLYARDYLQRCVDALDEHPEVVLAHSWTAMIDASGAVTSALTYPLLSASPSAPERLRSMLFGRGGDDFYGVVRARTVRRALRQGSYHHADHTMVSGIALYGAFYQVPDWLYFRREHPQLAARIWQPEPVGDSWPARDWPTGRTRCANMDPRRANRVLHPTARLYAEYFWGYIAAIRRAPLSASDRLACYRYLAKWAATKAHLGRAPRGDQPVYPAPSPISVDQLVAGRERVLS
jgi:glycosyltransferase involved in cell wall biosynthesis